MSSSNHLRRIELHEMIISVQVATKTQRIDLSAIALAQASFRIREPESGRVLVLPLYLKRNNALQEKQ